MANATFHSKKTGPALRLRAVIVLSAALAAAGCMNSETVRPQKQSMKSLGDEDAALAYATAFPLVSKEEGIALGDAALARGDLKRALFEYLRVLEQGEADPAILYKVGRIHQARGDNRRAEIAYALALKEDAENAAVLLELGILQLKRREYEAAGRLLNKSLEIAPELARAHNALGVLADMQHDYAAAQAAYGRALALGSNALYFNNLGYSLYLSGDLEAAEEAFEDALRVNPDYERAWRNLALLYARRGNYDYALEALRRIGTLPEAYNDLGYVAMLDGRLDEAGILFDEAMRVSPTYYELAGRNARRLEKVQRGRLQGPRGDE